MNAVRAPQAGRVGSRRQACPGGGEVAASPAGLTRNRVRDGLAARDPGPPLLAAVGKHRLAGEHEAAVFGVGQMLQRARQPQADFSIRRRSRRSCRLAASSNAESSAPGRATVLRSARRNRPRCSATRSRTCSSSDVVSNRVLIVTPDGPATGFTPRQSRNPTAVTHSIIPNRYDKLGTSITGDEDQ